MTDIERVLEYLKKYGKTSGGQVKSELEMSDSDYRAAKNNLRELGLVNTGRGRGGTIEAVEGAQIPEGRAKPSKAEIAGYARAAKETNIREKRLNRQIHDIAMQVAQKEFPDADRIEIQVWKNWGECFVYPFYNGTAQAHRLVVDTEEM